MTAIDDAGPDAHSGVMIDAPDTPDRDDAIWVRGGDDGFDAWVHIAPVARELTRGGSDDEAARRRMHTRYMP
ncbi:MAG: RNB domain-containing ribonuclease, partial [Stackebrandtia sp.]